MLTPAVMCRVRVATEDFESIDVRRVSDALGVEIRGVDLSEGLSEEQFAEIRRAFHEHAVIFFRDQTLTPEQHIEFARLWAGHHQRQPLLHPRRRLSSDRRGAQGARSDQEYPWRVAHRSLL